MFHSLEIYVKIVLIQVESIYSFNPVYFSVVPCRDLHNLQTVFACQLDIPLCCHNEKSQWSSIKSGPIKLWSFVMLHYLSSD